MHPIFSRPERAWVIGPLGGGIGSFLAILPLRRAGAAPEDAAWFSAWGILMLFGALQTWQVARYVRIGRTPLGRYVMTAVVGASVFGVFWMAAAWGGAVVLERWLPSVAPAIRGGAWLPLWLTAAAAFLCLLFLMQALSASDEGEAAARRALEADLASRDAELRALRAQVDPHFLFNCLHSISAMTSREPAAARRMCLELADFFRASIRAGAEQRIALADELGLVRGYLGIEQVRFGDRLRVEVDEPGERAGVMVPPLLLQPLVENAVRHGIATLVEGGTVRVTVQSSPGRVEIAVENPFDPDGRRAGTGVGLANVRDRLET
ncbi:MAG TPA: histidine kinase, partial [Vicinamibacterales bacterium]